MFVSELKDRWDSDPSSFGIQGADIERWCAREGMTVEEVYDRLGAELARGYHEGRIDFTFGDLVANQMFALGLTANNDAAFNGVFWQVYLAFDAGEYHRDPKHLDDPEQDHTRPLIAEIIAGLQS